METGGRFPGHLRLDSCQPSWPRTVTSRDRRRCAQPDPVFGSHGTGKGRPGDPAPRRCGSRRHPYHPLGRPASATAAPSSRWRTPNTMRSCRCRNRARWLIADWISGWTTTSAHTTTPTLRHRRGKGDGPYKWKRTTSRSSEPVRATAFSTNAMPASGRRSASRAPSAAPASMSGASPQKCSSTPPRWPRPSEARRVTVSTRTSTGCDGTTSSRASSGASIRSR